MDTALITSTAAAATTLLTPYLVKAGEKAAEEVGKKLPQSVGKVWSAITARFKGKPAAEEAVVDLVADPEDADKAAAFRNQLKKLLESNPDFAEELAELVRNAKPQEGDTIANTGSGAVATHGGVAAGKGGVAVKGDVHGGIRVGNDPEKD